MPERSSQFDRQRQRREQAKERPNSNQPISALHESPRIARRQTATGQIVGWKKFRL
jgi:hypothetical protein